MKTKRLGFNAGYTLASSSLLASLVYFFASNWGVLERWQKLSPMLLLVVALYGLYAFLRVRPNRQFLSKLSLLSCCIAFGIGLAVVGQTYNSHADSYTLFAVWFVAASAFALQIRWQPFYALAYVLAHLAYWLYFFPTVGFSDYEEGTIVGILSVLAAINGLVYVWTATGRLHSPLLKFLSYSMLIGTGIVLSNSLAFEKTFWIFNAAVVLLIAWFTYTFIRSANQTYLLWNGLLVSAFLVMKYVELLFRYFDESFFVTALLFVALFIWGGAKWIQYVKSLGPSVGPADADAGNKDEERGAPARAMVVRALTVSVIAIGTIIGTVTLIGFVLLVLGFENPEYTLSGFGLIVTIGMTAARKLNPVFRYTLLAIGLCTGVGTAIAADYTMLLLVYLAVTVAAFLFGSGLAERAIWFTAGAIIAELWLGAVMENHTAALTVLTVAMPAVYLLHLAVKDLQMRQAIRHCGYYAFLTVFLFLTFAAGHYAYDGIYFITLSACIVWAYRKREGWAYKVGFGFWALFVLWKYYDTAWKLLHKSWSLALIGAIVLAMTYLLERKLMKNDTKQAVRVRPRLSIIWITATVLAELLVMSVQIGRSETILANGATVYLELLPRDPRSLLQGDYVELRYAVSEPPASLAPESLKVGTKVAVVLARSPSGVYEFKRLYSKEYELLPDEAVINGKWRWDRIEYGIETYFVQEGTGLETERTAKYAEVKVAKNGNALLTKLLPALPQ
ncbi:DUF2157 domain-containing protein [Paenibacillus mesophilus]|uniref:GDYXXLXY domain-containing protein n=1 Tax=Paenibacillus mesophilus TaxID=2582849 RepID=UPI00110EB872|nr:GDYXXLXY domain-containing protein [Paenibacillus mesophilus]TMV52683.1 DUF2157 domain-containing protein [Paenibacillus mesophilus]